jgi:predicted RNA binding protein YcfA (HicA-like mRNA interferase family)
MVSSWMFSLALKYIRAPAVVCINAYPNVPRMCIMCVLDVREETVHSRDIIKQLQKDGWYEVNQVGSHRQFKHPSKRGRVTVPHPNRDIPIGTLKSIEKQAGVKLR